MLESTDPSRPLTPAPAAPSAWEPLRIAIFRSLWIANIVSNIGSTMNDTAAVWTMATLSHSAVLVTLMQTMTSLPLFLLALPAGAVADLVDRRWLMLLAQVGALLTAAGMAALAHWGHLTPVLLLVATFQLGVANAFTTPAWQAMLPEMVGRPLLPAAIALGGVGYNIARALGPIAGGLLVAWLGPMPVFALNAVSFGAVIAALATARSTQKSEPETEQMLSAMVAALRYARHAPAMRAVLWRTGVHVFAAVAPVALLPILIQEHSWDGSYFGVLMGCYGVGAIAAALFVLPRLRRYWSYDRVLVAGALGSSVAAAGLAVAHSPAAMGAALALAGAGWMTCLNTFSVAAQSSFPNWVRARSSAVYLVVMQGAYAVGALVWGRLVTDLHVTLTLGLVALWLALSALLARWRPVSHIEAFDLTPSQHWPEHSLATVPAPTDGPVLITVQYAIPPERVAIFRKAIAELRLIRRRDGAFRWSLFVDLDDSTHYRETFLVGSWAEHLRQHHRATREDQRIEDEVLACHAGPERPIVRHLLMIDPREEA